MIALGTLLSLPLTLLPSTGGILCPSALLCSTGAVLCATVSLASIVSARAILAVL